MDEDISDLPDLIRFCLAPGRLEIDDFRHAILAEYMMAAFDALLKPQVFKQENQIVKVDILIAATPQNQVKNLLQLAHAYSVMPDSFATVLMSLSPRPERLTKMI